MNIILCVIAFFAAFSVNAERSPLTKEQLQKEADQICSGTISDIQNERICINWSCTNYTINFTAKMDTSSCERNDAPIVYASFFENVYNEGQPPSGASAHYPQPEIGQIGTIYLRDGGIIYPNGWVPNRY